MRKCFLEEIKLSPSPFIPDIVFYHANCPDGFGAAWSYWHAHKEISKFKDIPPIDFYAIGHHDTELPLVKDKNVVMVDVVLSDSNQMNYLVKQSKSFKLLDHHKTAFDLYHKEPWAFFDLEKSGSVLAWEDSHFQIPLPRILYCIQERDLEKILDIDTESFLQVLDSIPRTFLDWDILHESLIFDPEPVLKNGRLMRERIYSAVDRLLQNAVPIIMNGYKGFAVNSQVELGVLAASKLSTRPGIDFGFSWYVDHCGLVRGSWRSQSMDVIELAKIYNGGMEFIETLLKKCSPQYF